jgi:hypothetical protein
MAQKRQRKRKSWYFATTLWYSSTYMCLLETCLHYVWLLIGTPNLGAWTGETPTRMLAGLRSRPDARCGFCENSASESESEEVVEELFSQLTRLCLNLSIRWYLTTHNCRSFWISIIYWISGKKDSTTIIFIWQWLKGKNNKCLWHVAATEVEEKEGIGSCREDSKYISNEIYLIWPASGPNNQLSRRIRGGLA